MPSIFNALNIGYSGLNASQVGISTTGHNISNAETDGYTRQKLVTAATHPLKVESGNVGNGVEIHTVKRVFDSFIFDRYTDASTQKEYADFAKQTLEQVSTFFPEIDAVGVKADLQEYYNMWQTFSDNPDNDSIKIALGKQAQILAEHIRNTQGNVIDMQSQLNDRLKVNIDEVNSLAKELAELNVAIDTAEAGTKHAANDLRDKRNVIERNLAKLIGAETTIGQIQSNIQVDSNLNYQTDSYTVSINGFNIVDGSAYHPIHINNDNSNGFYELSYEREDGILLPIEENISQGRVGAILDLRGSTVDTTSGVPKDGILQNTIAQLDAFAQGLIEFTNNIYAQNATNRMESNIFDDIDATNSVLVSRPNVNEGAFNIVIYDIDGNLTASREITIDVATTITGTAGSNSLEGQINDNVDDNGDNNANNDIDDFISFNWATLADGSNQLELIMDSAYESKGYKFGIEDKLSTTEYASGSNFAGAFGMNRFFDGDSATNMDLSFELRENPTLMSAGYTDLGGDNAIALNMIQQQFERYDFKIGTQEFNTTAYGMFDIIATEVGTHTNNAIMKSETVNTLFNSVELEYFSTSKVSIDEEMTNLIKFQTAYGASAKVITTIDQMMQTLLGIKQ